MVAGVQRVEQAWVSYHLSASESHFWFVARRHFLKSRLSRVLKPDARLIDVGCGDGAELAWMRSRVQFVLGVEPDPSLAAAATGRGVPVLNAPFPVASPIEKADIVTMFDVVEHIEDDRAVANSVFDLLVPGGSFALTVPAHQWLWGEHDQINRHFRRYSQAGLRCLLQEAGFVIESLEWFGLSALVTAAGMKALGRAQRDLKDVSGGIAERVALALYRAECPFRVPVGLSLFAIARRPSG